MKNCTIILGLIATSAIMSSCHGDIKEKEATNNKTVTNNVKVYENSPQSNPQTLDSIDVIALKEDYQNGLLQIYNEDKTIWKSFEVSDNFSDNSIMPLAQKAENKVLVFRCIGIKNNFYSVIVNEDKNIVKYIKPNVPYFNYEKWQAHIVKVFSIDFDYRKNPLKEKPLINSKILSFSKDQLYHPIEIKGEWLKVKDDDDKESWIRWQEKGLLIINLYYDA